MTTSFFLSELVLALGAFYAANQVRARAPEAAFGMSLLGAAALAGAATVTNTSVAHACHDVLSSAASIWSLPMVAMGWTMVFFGIVGRNPTGRVTVPALLMWPVSLLVGGSWALIGGIGAMVAVLALATRAFPVQPNVRWGAAGAVLALLAGAVGSEGAIMGVERIAVFHVLLAMASVGLATGLTALPGHMEKR
jgi:hypothetical protein